MSTNYEDFTVDRFRTGIVSKVERFGKTLDTSWTLRNLLNLPQADNAKGEGQGEWWAVLGSNQ